MLGTLLFTAAAHDPLIPSLSLIIPTNSRPEFVRHALDMIDRQAYPTNLIEVIVVDDSPESLRLPELRGKRGADDLRVSYIELSTPTSIGRKRSLAVANATGSLIVHWDDDDIYGPRRLATQVAPIARGDADVTLLEHELTYFMADDALYRADMPWSHRPSWGPHFGTLVYRRALLDTPGVGFSDTSEAEDYGFAQSAVQKAGAKLTVLPATVDVTGGALFACVRHGSNTWEWDEAQTREKLLRHGTEVDAAARLPAAERAFGRRMASEGVLSALPARRAVSPAPRRFVDASVDRAFFADLFYPPEARAALAAARGAAEQPVGDMPTAMGDLLGLQHL